MEAEKILGNFLEGCSSPQEDMMLFEWIGQSEEHAKMFREVESNYSLNHTPSVATLAAHYDLKKRISAGRTLNIFSFAAVAAAVIIGIFLLRTAVVPTMEPEKSQPSYYTFEAQNGTNSSITLPDGSRIRLNAGSTLTYMDNFNVTSRDVSLEGEAFFDVAHNEDMPFVISSGNCTFKVMGTRFDLCSYKGDRFINVALEEGSLKVLTPKGEAIMEPGDVVTVGKDMDIDCRKDDVSQFSSWTRDAVKFNSIYVPELLSRLSREYNVGIVLNTDEFNDYKIRASFSHSDDIKNIMAAISQILSVNVTYTGSTYYLNANK